MLLNFKEDPTLHGERRSVYASRLSLVTSSVVVTLSVHQVVLRGLSVVFHVPGFGLFHLVWESLLVRSP